MTSPSDLLNEKTLFQNWLESQSPETVVGLTDGCLKCPIANYLRAKGIRDPEIDRDYVYFQGEEGSLQDSLPDWAKEFIANVDGSAPQKKAPINAAQAIAILGSYRS
jgi:hypothetical protein